MSSGLSTQASVGEMLAFIKRNKVTEGKPLAVRNPAAAAALAAHENVCLVGESSGRIKWIQPSGEQAGCARHS